MRPHRWILALTSWLVPKDIRADWRAEWEGELQSREASLEQWPASRRGRFSLLKHSSGALWDALWLQSNRWYTLRLFGQHWRLAVAAVASLGVAMAAMVIGLSAYNALLLRPPGVSHPETLRLIHVHTAADPFGSASFPEYAAYRDMAAGAFDDIAAFPYAISSITLTTDTHKTQVVATQVSTNFFRVLGITPKAGILTLRTSTTKDVNDVVVSDVLWHTLGADPALVGSTLRLNDQPVTVAGIVPSSFGGMTWGFAPDVWMSLDAAQNVLGSAPTELTDRTNRWLHMIGRLKPGVGSVEALGDVQLVAANLARDHPETNAGRSAALTMPSVTPAGDRAWAAAILNGLILIVILTLVVACTNVTNLLLGLAMSRRHEMLVRAALGASRLQLVVPLLRESALVGLVAGLVGYGGAWALLTKLAAFRPPLGGLLPPASLDLRPDGFVLVGSMAIALIAGVAVGLAPALRSASEGISGSLIRAFTLSEPRRGRLRNLLVVTQMAVATIVLVGVGLSLRSVVNLEHAPLGFRARDLVFTGIDLGRRGYDDKTGPAFYDRIRDALSATPGVEAVTLASDAPLTGYLTEDVVAVGAPPPPDGHGESTPYAIVDDRYFATLGVDVLEGRTFDSRDRPANAEVAVVNATLARKYWPGQDPVGRELRVERGNRVIQVIAVVADGKYGDIDEAQLPFMYLALSQHYLSDIMIIARTPRPRDLVVQALAAVDPNLTLSGIGAMTFDELLNLSLLLPRIIVWTTMIFGTVALALAMFGLHVSVFYAVSQRRMEIGIRTTLGATPGHLFRLMLRESGWAALAGASVGLAAGLALVPLASSIFYGIGTVEPGVIAAVAVACTLIALGTTYLVVRPWTRLTALDLLRR